MALNSQVKVTLSAVDNASKTIQGVGLSFGKLTGAMALGSAISRMATDAFYNGIQFLRQYGTEAIITAGRIDMMKNTMYILAENLGNTREEVDAFVYSIREERKSVEVAIEVTQRMLAAGISLNETVKQQTIAENVLSSAREVGAVMGYESAEVTKAILDATTNLNPQLLRQYGIYVNLNIAYAAQAQALGKSVEALTTAEKRMALLNATFLESSKFTGAYNESMKSWYKVLLSIKDAMSDVAYVIGKLFTPVLEVAIQFVYDKIKAFREWALTSNNELTPAMERISEHIYNVFIKVVNFAIRVVSYLRAAFKELFDIAGSVTKQLSSLSGTTITASDVLEFFARVVYEVYNIAKAFALGIQAVVQTVAAFALGLVDAGKVAIAFGKDVLRSFQKIQSAGQVIMGALWKGVKGDFKGAYDSMKEGFSITLDESTAALNSFAINTGASVDAIYTTWTDSFDAITEAVTQKNFPQLSGVSRQTFDNIRDDLQVGVKDILIEVDDAFKNAYNGLSKMEDESKEASSGAANALKNSMVQAVDKSKDMLRDLVDAWVDYRDKVVDINKQISGLEEEWSVDNANSQREYRQEIIDIYRDHQKEATRLEEEMNDAMNDTDRERYNDLKEKYEEEVALLEQYAHVKSFVGRWYDENDIEQAQRLFNERMIQTNDNYTKRIKELRTQLEEERKIYEEKRDEILKDTGIYFEQLKDKYGTGFDNIIAVIRTKVGMLEELMNKMMGFGSQLGFSTTMGGEGGGTMNNINLYVEGGGDGQQIGQQIVNELKKNIKL